MVKTDKRLFLKKPGIYYYLDLDSTWRLWMFLCG